MPIFSLALFLEISKTYFFLLKKILFSNGIFLCLGNNPNHVAFLDKATVVALKSSAPLFKTKGKSCV